MKQSEDTINMLALTISGLQFFLTNDGLIKEKKYDLTSVTDPNFFNGKYNDEGKILQGLTMLAFDDEYDKFDLDDLVAVLEKANGNKSKQYAAAVFSCDIPSEKMDLLIEKLFLSQAEQIKESNLGSFNRNENRYVSFSREQSLVENAGINYKEKYIDPVLDSLLANALNHKSDPSNHLDFLEKFKNLFSEYLQKIINNSANEVPHFIRYNSYLLQRELKQKNVPQDKIRSFIGGYFFLRIVSQYINMYIKEQINEAKTDTEKEKVNIATNYISKIITSPIQAMSNKTSIKRPNTDLPNDEELARENAFFCELYDEIDKIIEKKKGELDAFLLDLSDPLNFLNGPRPTLWDTANHGTNDRLGNAFITSLNTSRELAAAKINSLNSIEAASPTTNSKNNKKGKHSPKAKIQNQFNSLRKSWRKSKMNFFNPETKSRSASTADDTNENKNNTTLKSRKIDK